VQDVPKIVLRRLQKTADKGSHPDADLLTAFAEQSLLESERARVAEHLARCGECREVVALALPATEDAAVASSTSPSRSGWPVWRVLRWGVVAAGIVVITSVGILRYQQRQQKNETSNAVLTARNENTSTEDLVNQPPPTSSELQEIRPRTKSGEQAGARKNAQSNRQGTLAANNSPRSLNGISPAPRRYAVGSGIAAGVGLGSGGQAAAGAKLTPSPSVSQLPAVPSSSETVEVESQTAAGAPAAESQVSDQLVQNQKDQPLKDESSEDLDAAKAYPRWSISSDGKLQRSLDVASPWVEIDPGPAPSRSAVASMAENTNELAKANKKVKAEKSSRTEFRALAAFGAEVWAGGSAAMLYHSDDAGAHWTRVLPSSSGATLTGDITGIEFSNPQHGRIATSNGEVWITTDAGQTWRRQ
jgi:Photosynthesis system II assembly factor YCF48